jgi:hypothetical protein
LRSYPLHLDRSAGGAMGALERTKPGAGRGRTANSPSTVSSASRMGYPPGGRRYFRARDSAAPLKRDRLAPSSAASSKPL